MDKPRQDVLRILRDEVDDFEDGLCFIYYRTFTYLHCRFEIILN